MKIATTPGAAFAFAVSILRIFACACGERRKYACVWFGSVDVVGELPGAGEEAVVLLALDRLADHARVRSHPWRPPTSPIAAAPCCTALTMLW